jgi:hypothetical protein
MSVHGFFETVENTAKVGNWGPTDKIQIVVLKLTEVAKAFYNSNLELHAKDITWENFKGKFLHRFRDVRNDQCNFIKLQTARQKPDEAPQEFADRCRTLALKTVPKVDDPELQKIYFQQAERMLLSTFIAGFIGHAGQQVRFKLPQTLDKPFKLPWPFLKRKRKKSEMKFLSRTGKTILVIGPQAAGSLDTPIKSRVLACGQEVSQSPLATGRQADSRLSKYMARPRESARLTSPCVVITAINWDTTPKTVIRPKRETAITKDSLTPPEDRKRKHLRLPPKSLGETTISRETSSRWK